MRLIEQKNTKEYEYKKYEIYKNKYMYIIKVCNLDIFKKLKSYYNGNGFTVKKVVIEGENERFKMYIYRGSIYTHGRTEYFKFGRKTPFYLTGL